MVAGLGLLLLACTTPGGDTAGPGRPSSDGMAAHRAPDIQRLPEHFITPPHMAGRAPVRIALLLPLSAEQKNVRDTADAMLNAAQLALFEFHNPDLMLIPKDTGGRPEGAALAAEEAMREGAVLILGPLFAASVTAVDPIARAAQVPVIAFSSDAGVANNNVFLLSFLPDQDVERIVDFAVLQNIMIFAGLIPEGDYGRRVHEAYLQALHRRNAQLFGIETYPPVAEAMFEPARRLALYDDRQYALQLEGDDGPERSRPDELPDVPYQAVLLPDGGTQLKSVAPLLPYFDVDPRKVRFLGTGLWDDPSLGREPSLVGGWFAAPAPEAHDAFAARFQKNFGRVPTRIASLAYDGVALAAILAQQSGAGGISAAGLTQEDGFAGVDGIFRFLPDGRNERGLAVMEMRPSGPKVIDPAPVSFAPRTF